MKNKLFIQVVVLAFFLGCETIVDIEVPRDPPSLVINSTLSDEEFIKVHISQSQYILEPGDYKMITGAVVELFEDGSLIETLPDSLGGYYISATYTPRQGKIYTIKVAKNGFETATAEVLMPLDTATILSVKTDTIRENIDGYTSFYLRFSVEIKDDKAYDNFYDISVYRGGYFERYDYSVDPPVLIDSLYSYQKLYLQSRDPGLEDFQSYGQNILFNDELFNGSTYKMNVLSSIWIDSDYPDENQYTYFVTVKNTSDSYYLYELSSQLQYWVDGDPFAQPVTVYNNIENGFGIFSAYNTAVFKVE
ncbi:MAG: DUF4249 domain-containing protein [Cyclobacteriaceae bacterium]|nr:DUF4249 domain-containing protein [Cyclobacteriaceae bacterium]